MRTTSHEQPTRLQARGSRLISSLSSAFSLQKCLPCLSSALALSYSNWLLLYKLFDILLCLSLYFNVSAFHRHPDKLTPEVQVQRGSPRSSPRLTRSKSGCGPGRASLRRLWGRAHCGLLQDVGSLQCRAAAGPSSPCPAGWRPGSLKSPRLLHHQAHRPPSSQQRRAPSVSPCRFSFRGSAVFPFCPLPHLPSDPR